MVDRVMALEEGTRLYLLAPIVRGRKGEYRKEFAELMKQGFQRVKVDGEFYEIADVPALDKKYKHDIDVVVDRIVVREDIAARLADSFETALKLADGLAIAEFADKPLPPRRGRRAPTSRRTRPTSASPSREVRLPGLRLHHPRSSRGCSPSTTRFGACPTCDGLGTELTLRRGADGARRGRCRLRGAPSRPGRRPASRPITRRRWKPSASTTASIQAAVERPADEGAATSSCAAPARRDHLPSTTTGCASTRPRSRSRA
jgi:excinuclease ABC subunit A